MSEWEIIEYSDEPDGTFTANAIKPTDGTDVFAPVLGAHFRFRINDGRPELLELTVHNSGPRRGDLRPITAEDLRAIPFVRLMNQAELALQEDEAEDLKGPINFHEIRKEWPKGDLEKVSKVVAHLYNTAVQKGIPRPVLIADTLEVSHSTANRMIAKARELGYIRVSSALGRPKKQGKQHGQKETRPQ